MGVHTEHKKIILNTNHHALKFFNNSSKFNRMHARWIAYIRKFNFFLRRKYGQHNKDVDASSRRIILLINIWSDIKDAFTT